jgi:NAD(P)-dependent dehydrogenase (short-subunit alcohol dehydrogenase family)
MTSERLKGKVAVVTGTGSNGIGRGVAMMFAAQGALVVGSDIDETGSEETLALAKEEGLSFHSLHPLDLTTPKDAQALMDFAVEKHGRIDILVNAAAFGAFAFIEDMTYEAWRRTLTGELDIVFLACKAAWPHLIKSGSGAIVNFASANARQALQGSGALAHCAGKGGVLAMTRQLAMEGGPHNIRANTISPGMIVTGATRDIVADPAFEAEVLRKKMIKRLGRPQDVGHLATFLASEEASWITGADFALDGGATAW